MPHAAENGAGPPPPSSNRRPASSARSGHGSSRSGSPGTPYTGKVRKAQTPTFARPRSPTTPLTDRAPKAWSLAHVLKRSIVGQKIAKTFAPQIKLADPNRVRVGIRIRPMSEGERKRGEGKEYLKVSDFQLLLVNPRPLPGQEAKRDEFAFDNLYSAADSSEKVYKDLAMPLVDLLLEGYNGAIFAYGQTGSGKTHSIMGSAADLGMVPRVTSDLFAKLGRLGAGTRWVVRVSYLEVYREVLHDLLSSRTIEEVTDPSRDTKNDLKIRRDPKRGIYVQGLTEIALSSADGLQAVLDQGNERRAVAETLMNSSSSRSHAIITLNLEREDPPAKKQRARKLAAKLNLVDLAGSERVQKSGATGETLKEAIAINQSLSALGNVRYRCAPAGLAPRVTSLTTSPPV